MKLKFRDNLHSVVLSTIATLSVALATETSVAAIIVESDEAYPGIREVFTVDPHAGVNANRGLTTTRELRQSFKNPTTFDVKKIVVSLDINNAATGLLLKFYEVDDVNVTPIVLGTLVQTLTVPAGTYGNSSQRMGFTLTDADVFSLPQRDAGTTGYALGISQIDTAGVNAGVWHFANTGVDNYTDGKFYIESGAQSSATRDAGVAISSVPEPASVGLALLGMWGLAGLWTRRRGR
jgi:hypothetical protein